MKWSFAIWCRSLNEFPATYFPFSYVTRLPRLRVGRQGHCSRKPLQLHPTIADPTVTKIRLKRNGSDFVLFLFFSFIGKNKNPPIAESNCWASKSVRLGFNCTLSAWYCFKTKTSSILSRKFDQFHYDNIRMLVGSLGFSESMIMEAMVISSSEREQWPLHEKWVDQEAKRPRVLLRTIMIGDIWRQWLVLHSYKNHPLFY